MSFSQNPQLVYSNIPQYVAGPPPPAPPGLPVVYMPQVGQPMPAPQPMMQQAVPAGAAPGVVPGQYVLVNTASPAATPEQHQSPTPTQYIPVMQQPLMTQAPMMMQASPTPPMAQQAGGSSGHLQSLFTVHPNDAVAAAMHSLNNSIDVRSASNDNLKTPSMSASHGQRNDSMMRSTDSRSSVNSETPCRHFLEGKCNRRKCRFKHDPDALIDNALSPSNSVSSKPAT